MKRRDFILATGAGLVAAPRGGIVDTHIHLYDPTRPQGVPWPPKNDSLLYRRVLPENFVDLVRPLGITGTVVVEASAWAEDNQWILDLAKDNPIIVGHVGHLEPGKDEFRRDLARFSRNPLFRGIRLNGGTISSGISRPLFIEDLERLADLDLMMDAIGSATMIPALLTLVDKIPKLRIAIDHMPSEPPGWVEARAKLRDLAGHPQVYAKVSGVIERIDGKPRVREELLDEVWHMFGPDRVMYGSNWPVSDRVAPYSFLLKVMKDYLGNKDAQTSEKYFRLNSRSCYKWVERQA